MDGFYWDSSNAQVLDSSLRTFTFMDSSVRRLSCLLIILLASSLHSMWVNAPITVLISHSVLVNICFAFSIFLFISCYICVWDEITVWFFAHNQMSNGDIFEKNHDELDFEFLGNIRGKEWRIQTNIYGNGSTGIGREERYGLWFDPSEDFHKYSILWTDDQIM